MMRYLKLLNQMYQAPEESRMTDMKLWREKFVQASKNRLEPEFLISPLNSWVPFIDKNFKGANAYYGLLPEECLDDEEIGVIAQ